MISWIGLTKRQPASQAEVEEDISDGVMPMFIVYPSSVGVETFELLLSPKALGDQALVKH